MTITTSKRATLLIIGLMVALCFSMVSFGLALLQAQNANANTRHIVVENQQTSDVRWCTLFNTIINAPREPGQPAHPTPSQIRFGKALVKLNAEFHCKPEK